MTNLTIFNYLFLSLFLIVFITFLIFFIALMIYLTFFNYILLSLISIYFFEVERITLTFFRKKKLRKRTFIIFAKEFHRFSLETYCRCNKIYCGCTAVVLCTDAPWIICDKYTFVFTISVKSTIWHNSD